MVPRCEPVEPGVTAPVVPGFPAPGHAVEDGSMVEILHIALGVLLVGSLATIVAYVVVFVAVALWTALRHRGVDRDPLADELDAFLAELWALDSGTVLGAGLPPRALARGTGPRRHLHGRTDLYGRTEGSW